MKTVTQTAAIFGVTRKTILNWIDKGRIKAISPAGMYLISEEEIERLMKGNSNE